jgi:membrane-associated phospholipid phosphatase
MDMWHSRPRLWLLDEKDNHSRGRLCHMTLDHRPMNTTVVFRRVALWLVAIAIAAALDGTVATWLHDHQIDAFLRSQKLLRETLKAPGFFGFTVALAIVVTLLHRLRWRAGLFVLIAGATAGVNQLLKWTTGRYRPFTAPIAGASTAAPFEFHPFPSSGRNLCFPSGHAALAFATAAALGMLWPRGRWLFYVLAMFVAAERVAENAHWLSDTVAAAAIGIGGAMLVRRLFSPLLVEERTAEARSAQRATADDADGETADRSNSSCA